VADDDGQVNEVRCYLVSLQPGYLSDHWPAGRQARWRKPGRRRGFRRPVLLLLMVTPVVLLATAAIVTVLLAAHYQPLSDGGAGGGSFPGLPEGAGIRWVDGPPPGDLYVPPQRGTFALSFTMFNDGTYPVTIEAVTQQPGSPLIPAGPVLYFVDTLQNEEKSAPGLVLHGLTLRPGQGILVGMPLRTSRCGYRHLMTIVTTVLVRERFLTFTRTVPVPIIGTGAQVLVNTPGGRPGNPTAICATR
jgi:hypothetical protein